MQQTKYAEHLKACAEIANEVMTILGVRDDAARQACFATICISADRHGLFMEPVHQNGPSNGSTPKTQPATASKAEANGAPVKQEREDLPEANKGALQDPTPEQADGAKRAELLKAINA